MTADLIRPGTSQYQNLLTGFTRSAFRLETLQVYAADDGLAAFQAGAPEPPDPHHDAWCERISEQVRDGKVVQRVHVVREPVTTYMAYELTWGYAPNVRAGEDVRIVAIGQDAPWPPAVPQYDYWLFDDDRLYRVLFEADGSLLGVRPFRDQEAIEAGHRGRDAALALGVRWGSYLAARPHLARHLDMARA